MSRAAARSLPPVRVIDTGIRGARANVAFDQALIEARGAGRVPDTIRFLRFRPSVLVGLHQILSHEVRLDYCRANGIEVGRRVTGGGALYLDEGQIGWELVLGRGALGTTDLARVAARICEAAAAGLRRLGAPAQFRPRNDIEVEGRKISGTGGFFDGSTLFYQGTLLVDFDPARMIAALKVPVEKLAKRDLDDARRRVITLREVLGRSPRLEEIHAALLRGFRENLGLEPVWGAAGEHEEALAQRLYEAEFGTDSFVRLLDAAETGDTRASASLVRRSGTLRADMRLEGPGRERIREALITGDFFITPPRAIFDLEASLRGRDVAEAGAAVDAFFARGGCALLGLAPADFREVVERALRQLTLHAGGRVLRGHRHGPGPEEAPTLVFLHDALGSARLWGDFPDRLARASGCGTLVYDRWGSGDSEALSPPYRRDYLLEEALVSLPAVLHEARVRDAILVGQSDGAAIALAHAGAFPQRVRGVVAIAPHLYREAKTLAAIREQIADYERGDLRARLARHHGARTDALFGRLAQLWTAGAAGTGWGLDEHVARVRCPVFAIQGEEDEFFSAAQLAALEALLPGRLETLRLAHCGHYPVHQARVQVLAAAARFVGALRSDARAALARQA